MSDERTRVAVRLAEAFAEFKDASYEYYCSQRRVSSTRMDDAARKLSDVHAEWRTLPTSDTPIQVTHGTVPAGFVTVRIEGGAALHPVPEAIPDDAEERAARWFYEKQMGKPGTPGHISWSEFVAHAEASGDSGCTPMLLRSFRGMGAEILAAIRGGS